MNNQTVVMPARHFTVQSLADYWGVSPSHIYNLIRSNALRHMRIGKSIRIPTIFVTEYEEQSCQLTMISTNLINAQTESGTFVGTTQRQISPALNAYQRGQQTAAKQKDSARSTLQELKALPPKQAQP
ncbi:MAG: helix-turn-helix domain-containing protein [Alphaproteobacteria bacterium]|nr:helix-turn-helix domain-containing protein [Alphaproteobacteria bacterium]